MITMNNLKNGYYGYNYWIFGVSVLLLWILCGRADGRGKEKLGKGGGMKEGRCTTAAYRTGGKAAV
jgi:hypothetical protein